MKAVGSNNNFCYLLKGLRSFLSFEEKDETLIQFNDVATVLFYSPVI